MTIDVADLAAVIGGAGKSTARPPTHAAHPPGRATPGHAGPSYLHTCATEGITGALQGAGNGIGMGGGDLKSTAISIGVSAAIGALTGCGSAMWQKYRDSHP